MAKQKKVPTKGKKATTRRAAATNTTTTTNTSASNSTTNATRATRPSARHLSSEARGEPHALRFLRNNLSQRRCRAKKKARASPAWLAAAPEERLRIERAAVDEVMAGQPDLRARGAAAGTKMGRTYGGWKEKGEERREDEDGEEEDEDEDMGEEPDDEPTLPPRRRDDEDEEDDPTGEYTRKYMAKARPNLLAPRQVA